MRLPSSPRRSLAGADDPEVSVIGGFIPSARRKGTSPSTPGPSDRVGGGLLRPLEDPHPVVETSPMDLPHYSDHPDDPVYFYGGPFSNFVGGSFYIESAQPWGNCKEVYQTIEHFYQASKARDPLTHTLILRPTNPWEAKRLGNSCLLREDWEDVKYEVMMEGLRVKFAEPEWKAYLLDTGDRFIAEDSPTDFIWGIRDGAGGQTGQNLLGKALMEIRQELRSAAAVERVTA